jgi:tRNA(Arg) A34 adenosine deaminase TadA
MNAETELQDLHFIRIAIDLASQHARARDGGPFGALIVRAGEILGSGWNKVTSSNDPTAHAEIVAIRAAAEAAKSFLLRGCVLYASCEPCPMCMAAAYWARVDRVVFAATRSDAGAIGFDDSEIYSQLALPVSQRKIPIRQLLRDAAVKVMAEWSQMPDRIAY